MEMPPAAPSMEDQAEQTGAPAKTVTVPRADLPECSVGDVYEAKVTAADDQGVTLELAGEKPEESPEEQYNKAFDDKTVSDDGYSA